MLPRTAVVMMLPMMMPLITTTSVFMFSGRFSIVGISANDVAFMVVAMLAALPLTAMVALIRADEDAASIRDRLVDIALAIAQRLTFTLTADADDAVDDAGPDPFTSRGTLLLRGTLARFNLHSDRESKG